MAKRPSIDFMEGFIQGVCSGMAVIFFIWGIVLLVRWYYDFS